MKIAKVCTVIMLGVVLLGTITQLCSADAPPDLIRKSAPVFLQPVVDVHGIEPSSPSGFGWEGHNDIVRVYYRIYNVSTAENVTKVEYNIVFKDEDHPDAIANTVQDNWRELNFGWIEDIETIIIWYEGYAMTAFEFPTTYSKDQQFWATHPDGYTETVHNPTGVIYINTWNHLFADCDTNPGMEKYMWVLKGKKRDWKYEALSYSHEDKAWRYVFGNPEVWFSEGGREDAEEYARLTR